jgi:23S rRNA pseudouridine2605 synthase
MEKKNFGDRRPSDSSRSNTPQRPSNRDERPPRTFGDKPSFGGDRKPFNRDERPRTFGDKPSFGGDRKPFNRDERPRTFGDKPSFGGDRKPFNRDERPRTFGDKPSFGGDRKPFNRDERPRTFGDKPSFGGDRKPFNRDERPRTFGDKPSFGGDRKPFNRDERPPRTFDGDRKPFNRDERPPRTFDGDRKPFNRDERPPRAFDGDRKPFNRDERPPRTFDGDRKPFNRDERPPRTFDGDRKPFNRDERPRTFGDKPSFGGDRKPFNRDERPPRAFDGDRKPFNRDERPPRTFDGDRKPFNRDERPPRTFDGDRKPFNREDRPSGGDRKPFNNDERPPRRFASDRSEQANDGTKPFNRVERTITATKTFGSDETSAPRERKVFKKEIGSSKFEERTVDEYKVEKSLERKAKISTDNPKFKKSSFERDRFEDVEKGKEKNPDEMRLNRFISHAGVCSRRDADELIRTEQVKVNGKVVTEMGYQVKMTDEVKLNGKLLTPERFVYVLLNKPKDYITTTEDPNERRTVMDLVAGATSLRIYPVGRLDRNTTGLLLLTNDGSLADKLTHPSHEIRKVYQAELDKKITEEHVDMLIKGIQLEDGEIKADDVSIITPDAEVVGVEIHSGRNRIVRRMFEHLGYDVVKLDRTMFGPLTKKELPRGEWRYLSEREIVRLKTLK